MWAWLTAHAHLRVLTIVAYMPPRRLLRAAWRLLARAAALLLRTRRNHVRIFAAHAAPSGAAHKSFKW
jgi:hypothetical protein